jgi:hypothetical protein
MMSAGFELVEDYWQHAQAVRKKILAIVRHHEDAGSPSRRKRNKSALSLSARVFLPYDASNRASTCSRES